MPPKSLNRNLTLNLNPPAEEGIKSKITIRIKNQVVRLLVLGCLVSFAPAQPQPLLPNPAAIMLSPQPSIDTTSPVTATAVFDPPVIRPGGSATYRVSFNALIASVEWQEEIIASEQLELLPSARGEVMTPGGLGIQPHAAFNYHVRATKAGSFLVPRFIVYVYGKPVTVPMATLEVTTNDAAPFTPRRELLLKPANTSPFVGQTIALQIVLPASSGGVQPLNPVKLNGDGFVASQNPPSQRMDIFPEYGANGSSLICDTTLTPMRPGKMEIAAQGFTAGLNAIGPITIRGNITLAGMNQPAVLLDSEPVTLNVRPLPREKELPGFNGAIGHFKIDAPKLDTNVLRVGDPVTLSVVVRGDGDLTRLVAPPMSSAPGWQIFAGPNDPAPPQLIQARGFTTFSYTLIPTSEETRATPKIPFSYFDPDKAAYVDLSVPPVNVTVKPGAMGADATSLTETNEPASALEKQPRLTALATVPGRSMSSLVPVQFTIWFPFAQLVPACALAALWFWDRRRRFHEAHPEVMLRRRARRALHREWAGVRQAAALGDTSRFAACAVSAMRVACAPHYPAEPRALVSSDVVPLLNETDGTNAMHVVRRIFAAADAERFAEQPPNASDVLALRGELDRVLAQLEAKL